MSGNAQAAAARPAVQVLLPAVVLDAVLLAGASTGRARHLVVRADTVRVVGHCLLPGATVEILARRIEFAPASAIDVSGAATSGFDAAARDPGLDGTAQHLDGRQGAGGPRGNDGGLIRICAHEVVGTAALLANGSAGGRSQRGGDGFAHVSGQNARRDAGPVVGDMAVPPGAIAGIVRMLLPGLDSYQRARYGGHAQAWLRFGTLGQGGRGGLPGRPGDGGNGGRIVLRHGTPLLTTPVLGASGGAAGQAGDFGARGEPGADGAHLLLVNLGHGYEIHDIDRYWQYELQGELMSGLAQLRAAAASTAEVVAEQAAAGRALPDAVSCTAASNAELASECPLDYLELIRALAARDIALAKRPRGVARYQWLADLTGDATEQARSDLHAAAAQALAALPPADVAPAATTG
ncbi:MAG: hypothetical protein AW08_02301 [Candidatus Accumulibacter adjunctus]|uniref:Uncharacterized protein n=1 Tax=Candidatus Accumulibacter adjunctus TaxID=1454001 RepID=A0A011NRF6_9PROT|nr:MAG: hypothetical protein AW08_02301 [Candidatus Accumulibacter adjunctus]